MITIFMIHLNNTSSIKTRTFNSTMEVTLDSMYMNTVSLRNCWSELRDTIMQELNERGIQTQHIVDILEILDGLQLGLCEKYEKILGYQIAQDMLSQQKMQKLIPNNTTTEVTLLTYEQYMNISDKIDTSLQINSVKWVKQILKDFFSKHEEVKELYWTQYTPNMNDDNDQCIFTRNDIMARIDSSFIIPSNYFKEFLTPLNQTTPLGYDSDDPDHWLNVWYLDGSFPYGADFLKLDEMLMDKMCESAFGDHMYVRATRQSILINPYNHD